MKAGDLVFFYHSNASPPAIVGSGRSRSRGLPGSTLRSIRLIRITIQRAQPNEPTWFMVDLRAVERLPRPVTLDELKKQKGLETMALLRIGRLSVQPVTSREYGIIRKLADKR